ncbi:MFS transporter [Moritella sp. 24]|nr:MFS transporter [Moritella sp. 24]
MLLACLIVMMAQMATTIYLPSLPEVMSELGMTRSATELSISLFVIGAAIPALFWGEAVNRYGRRLPLNISLFLFITTSVLLSLCQSETQLLLLRMLQGVAAGGTVIVARILVRDNWQHEELTKRLSLLSIAFIVALGGGQFLGGVIHHYSDWRLGFVILSILGLLAVLLARYAPVDKSIDSHRGSMWMSYYNILKTPAFLWPCLVGGLGFAITVTLQAVSPFVFKEQFNLDAQHLGSFGLFIGASYFFGALLVNRTIKRIGSKRMLRIGAIIVFISTFTLSLFWYAREQYQYEFLLSIYLTLYVLTIFGQAVLFPNSMAIAVNSHPQNGAHAMALCGFLQQGLAGIAAASAVALEYHGLWTVAVAVLGGSALLIVLIKVKH